MAVKRSVDADPRPGRFVLTGSVRADLDSELAGYWPTHTQPRDSPYDAGKPGALSGGAFVDRIVREGASALRVPSRSADIRDYVGMALAGAFPKPALRLSERARRRWYDGCIQQLLTRDATEAEPGRDPVRLRRYFEAVALNTAGTADQTTLIQAAGIDRKTGVAYEHWTCLKTFSSTRSRNYSRLSVKTAGSPRLADPLRWLGLRRANMGVETESEVMDERLSDQARLTIQGSAKQALQLDSHAIGTEHLLLSLLIEGDGARKTLEMLAISPESIRQHVLAVAVARPTPWRTIAGTKSPDGHIPFTSEAQKVIERASREALKLGHRYLGTEHMLLALIRERNGLAGRVLADLGADLDTARGFVARLIEEDGVPAGIPPEWAYPEPRQIKGGMSRWRRKRSQ